MDLGLLVGKPNRDTTGHLQSNVYRLQVPSSTGPHKWHNQCFQQVHEDMYKVLLVWKEWDFVWEQHQGTLSDEDVTEVWVTEKSEVISKVTKMWVGTRGQKHLTLYKPGREWSGKTFWLSIQVWFGHHRNMYYYSDMKSISETHYTPILEGLNTLTEKRGWVVKVLSTPSVKISYFHFSKNKRFHLSSQDSSHSGGKEWLESIWDEHRGWKKNYLQAGYLISVREWEIIR